jgi:hypothetical protein
MRGATSIGTLVLGFAGLVGCGSTTRSNADETSIGGTGGSGGSVGAPALPDAWQACADSTECVATFPGCCDHCAETSLDNSVAIARDSVAAYRDSVCSDATVCPRCVSNPNPNLHAVCTEGRCTLVDISTTPLVHCSEPSDCKLRPAACCECDPSAQWISINTASETDYADLVCGPDTNCPECTIEVTDIGVLCDAGRCVVRAFGP